MRSFDFQVVLQGPLETVFHVYVDTDRWCNRNFVGDIRWVQGTPWQRGSRMRRRDTPSHPEHDRAGQNAVYLSHVFGMTCETSVTFTPVSVQETAFTPPCSWSGPLRAPLGFALAAAIKKATLDFFEELRRECEGASRHATENGGS